MFAMRGKAGRGTRPLRLLRIMYHVLRITNHVHVLRITYHISRITNPLLSSKLTRYL